MLIINNLELSLDTDFSCLIPIVAKVLREPQTEILSAELYRRSVDARRKSDIKFCCSVLVTAKNEGRILKRNKNLYTNIHAPSMQVYHVLHQNTICSIA